MERRLPLAGWLLFASILAALASCFFHFSPLPAGILQLAVAALLFGQVSPRVRLQSVILAAAGVIAVSGVLSAFLVNDTVCLMLTPLVAETVRALRRNPLPYLLAVALIDGQVLPAQYCPERIGRSDVQGLLRKVQVRQAQDLSDRFPDEMPCRLRIKLRDGRLVETEKADYQGFHTRPMSWETVVRKFELLGYSATTESLRHEIVDAVANLEQIPIAHLTDLLAQGRIHS